MLYRRTMKNQGGTKSKGATWYYDFWFKGRRYNASTHETSKERAREVERQKRDEVRLGKAGVLRDIPFSYTGDESPVPLNLSDEYLKLHAEQKKSKAFFEWTVAVLKRHFKQRLLSEVTARDVEEFLSSRRQDVKTATANRSLTVLKHMFRKAVEWGYARENPVATFKPVKERNHREFFLSKDQAEDFLGSVSDRIRPVVLAALHTGARRGELLALTWADVDMERRLLAFRDTKNGEDRIVKMSQRLAATLRALPRPLHGGHVFGTVDGAALEATTLRADFERAVKKAGLTGFRFHDLRHSAASFLVQAGVPLNTVRQVLGHKSLSMTLRYAHLAPDHLQEAAAVMDGLAASKEQRQAAAGAGA